MNPIKAIQQNNIFKVNPVSLYGNREQYGNNKLDSGLFSSQSGGNYNLNHPKVIGSETQAKFLDLMA